MKATYDLTNLTGSHPLDKDMQRLPSLPRIAFDMKLLRAQAQGGVGAWRRRSLQINRLCETTRG